MPGFRMQLPKVNLHRKGIFVVLWVILSNFLLFFGGALNPRIACNQYRRRMQLPSLLDLNNPNVGVLNENFDQFLQESEQIAKTRNQFSSLEEYEVNMVEIFTYLRVKYKSDFMQYLTIDHLPTVSEVIQTGVDDWDGRAIFAATLLLFRGYDAWVLAGPWHQWVQVILGNSTSLQILDKKGLGMKIWYLRFNDREVVLNYVKAIGYIFYKWFSAFLIIAFLFYSYKYLQTPFIRQAVRIIFFIAVGTFVLYIVALLMIFLFYRIIWLM
ncbi:MAG: hypothetical protein ACE5R6_08570 [Candidatus Heimdallarchaeota archaeon]